MRASARANGGQWLLGCCSSYRGTAGSRRSFSASSRNCQAAKASNDALRQLAPDIQWIESYVASDKTFCVYLAKNEDVIRKHAEISGFPATTITEVKRIIDPTTAMG